MRVLVCGSRNWVDEERIFKRLASLPSGTIIIEGGCRGADIISRNAAIKLGFRVVEVLAQWKTHGKAAGPIRNRLMLDLKPDVVLAFHENIRASKGTKDCIGEAERRGIKTEIHS